MNTVFILNDAPYGSERCYNGLRLATALLKADGNNSVTVFLLADAAGAAKQGQKVPEGYYSVERMLKRIATGRGQILLCGTCMDARGIADKEIIEGSRRSTMDELATITSQADKVLAF